MSVRVEISDEEILRENMPDSQSQIDNSGEVKGVLEYQYEVEGWFVTADLAIVPPDDREYTFRYLSPDVSFFRGVIVPPEERRTLSSWRMRLANRPAPTVVFEISSRDTWRNDLDPKPQQYGDMGVKEYYAFDPVGFWPSDPRLRGWRYADGVPTPIESVDGRLWSVELESWIVIEDFTLHFYDAQGNRRLKRDEALAQQVDTEQIAREIERLRADSEYERAERERFRAETQRLKAEEAQKRAEEAQQMAAQQQQRAEEAQKQIVLEQQRAEEAQKQMILEQQRAEEARQEMEQEQQRAEEARQKLAEQTDALTEARQEIERQQAELALLREQLGLN